MEFLIFLFFVYPYNKRLADRLHNPGGGIAVLQKLGYCMAILPDVHEKHFISFAELGKPQLIVVCELRSSWYSSSLVNFAQ